MSKVWAQKNLGSTHAIRLIRSEIIWVFQLQKKTFNQKLKEFPQVFRSSQPQYSSIKLVQNKDMKKIDKCGLRTCMHIYIYSKEVYVRRILKCFILIKITLAYVSP